MPARSPGGELQKPEQVRAHQLQALSVRPVEVYCRVPVELAFERYALRGSLSEHHEVHVARTLPIETFEEFQMPMNLGPVIEVDTTVEVDIDALATEVSSLLST